TEASVEKGNIQEPSQIVASKPSRLKEVDNLGENDEVEYVGVDDKKEKDLVSDDEAVDLDYDPGFDEDNDDLAIDDEEGCESVVHVTDVDNPKIDVGVTFEDGLRGASGGYMLQEYKMENMASKLRSFLTSTIAGVENNCVATNSWVRDQMALEKIVGKWEDSFDAAYNFKAELERRIGLGSWKSFTCRHHLRSRRAACAEIFHLGSVSAAVRALHSTAEPGPSAKALRILKSTMGHAKGCAALCEDAEEAVAAVVGKEFADVLLWRRRNVSVVAVVGATAVWFLFERAGYSLQSVMANALLLLVAILFFWAKSSSLLNSLVLKQFVLLFESSALNCA
ncbi:hypothetical protein E2562_022341, partial [Oryza meyeriana var. granulata]